MQRQRWLVLKALPPYSLIAPFHSYDTMSMTTDPAAKRRRIRFRADPLEIAQVDFGPLDVPFTPGMSALIVEESPMAGCGLVLLHTPDCYVGAICRVKVGRLSPLRAEVRWQQVLGEDAVRVGFMFLE